jgi:hypothetical protein
MKYTKPLQHLISIRYLYFALGLCGIFIAAVAHSPAPTRAAFKSPAQERSERESPALPDYDIRISDNGGFEDLDLTSNPGRQRAEQNAQVRARLTAVDEFRSLRPEAGQNLRAIANEAGAMKNFFIETGTLSEPQSATPDNIARNFLSRHADLFALKAADVSNLKLTNEDNDQGTVFLEYAQTRGGIKVFQGQVQVVVNKNGEVVSVREGLLINGQQVKLTPTLSEAQGIAKAFEHAGKTIAPSLVETHTRESQSEKSRFANPLDPKFEEVLSELTAVRVDNTARLAWDVYAEVGPLEWYEILIDAHTGELLYRHNLYVSAQGTVFTKSPDQVYRQLVSFDGDVSDPFGWMGSSRKTIGYNVEAYLDTDDNNVPDNIDGPGLCQGYACTPTQDFTFPFSPTADPRTQQAAGVTNLFYFNNFMHDFSYKLGFTETARNFQLSNYGMGGSENDPVLAEAQDGSARSPAKHDNAFFACLPEGSRPKMEVYLYMNPEPDRDGSLDSDLVFHEYGHGISNRLIGNCSGLLGNQARALGEGWSDYWAITINGDGAFAEYANNNPIGARRAVYTVPANPVHDSYDDLGPNGVFEAHNDGEVWAATLWDLRTQLGATTTDRLVLLGMKFTPTQPTFLTARDGILQADQSLFNRANRCTIWTVFAHHGMGYSAIGDDGYPNVHIAATDRPTDCSGPPVYEGYVDGANCSQIWGWAWDANRPNQPINVDLYAGYAYQGTVSANMFRQDLLNAGKGNGYHAFVFNTPDYLKNGQTQSISVRFGGTTTSLFATPRSILCGASLFPTEVPETTASGQGLTWEQGVEFSSSVSGTIAQIRFWRPAEEPMGNHVGHIWTASGTPLLSASFNETPGYGWQYATVNFPITAGVRYRVTYNANYFGAKTFNALNSPITRTPLTAWASAYATPAGTFPTSGSGSNLFADIVFNSPQ